MIGRPAELAEDADGTIYVSDDYANAVYRIVPGGSQTLDIGRPRRCRGRGEQRSRPMQSSIARGATAFGQRGCQECHALDGDGKDGRVVLAGLATRYDADEPCELPRAAAAADAAGRGRADARRRWRRSCCSDRSAPRHD